MWGHREKMGAPSFRLVLAKGWQRRSSSGVIPSEVAPNGARPSRRIGCHRLPHFRNHRPPHRRNAAILYITDFLLARSLPSKLETFPFGCASLRVPAKMVSIFFARADD